MSLRINHGEENPGSIDAVPRQSAASVTMALANDQKQSDGEYFNEERVERLQRLGAPLPQEKHQGNNRHRFSIHAAAVSNAHHEDL
jgi:hypothetical protein